MSAAAAAARLSPRRAAAHAVRRMSPRLRRRLVALAVAAVVLAGVYQFWLRDSSLVAVERVQVTGLTSTDAGDVRSALTVAARRMTTLHVDRAALERAVAGYPVVRRLEVAPDFPHGLRVHVVEYQPAAIAVAGGGRVLVAGDGTILRGVEAGGHLPTVDVEGALGDARLADATALGAAAVAGYAPPVLRSRIENVEHTGDGYVAELRDGPDLIFGPATRLRAKWAAATRVLADLESRGASYVDLRIPSRPAAGGLAATAVTPVAPAGLTEAVPPSTTAVTPESAATAVPDTVTPDATATEQPATPTAETPAAQSPVTPAEPLTAGAGGGATAAP